MNKITLLLFLFILNTTWAQNQEFTISGKIVDNESQEPLEYATISILSSKTSKVVTGGITNEKGDFKITLSRGVYDISFEFISFKTKKLVRQKILQNKSFGTIYLQTDTESLEETIIIAEKTTVDIKLDKKIYNVGKDLTVRGGTVSDVLDNVPSVSVDVEGNVALRGNDNVRILINGKPSGLVGISSTDALRQLPAESIERVEVITSPSARYDAEGTAGILNIILRRSKLQGLNGAITLNSGYPYTAGISGNLNYRTGDFNFFTTSGYNYSEIPGYIINETQYIFSGLPNTFLREERNFDRIRKGYNTNVGLEWYINESSSITTSFLYRSSDNKRNTTNLISEYSSLGGTLLSENKRFDPEIEDDITKQYSLNYTKNFEKSGHKLTVDFQKENSEEEEDSRITQENINTIELVNTLESQDRILLQTDYVLPLGKNSQFELGYRGNFNTLKTNYLVQYEEEQNITTDTDLSNNLIYKEHINAVYTQFGSKCGKFSYLLGLRLEETRITIDQQTSLDFSKKSYINGFPTINLGYEFTENQSIQLGYNRRIRRPRSRFINPFPSRSSPTNLFQGNPDLNPSYANALDLGYLNKMGKLTLNTSVFYTRSTQNFTFIAENTGITTTIGSDENNPGTQVSIIKRTPINLTSSDRYGFETTVTYNPNKKWRVNGNINIFQESIKGNHNNEVLDADNFSWFARLSNKITLPKKIEWQTSFFYRGPSKNAITERNGIGSINLAFSKELFKEKASLTFAVNDLLNSRKRKITSFDDRFISDVEFQWRERSFNLSFTYRFNQKKKRRRSNGRQNGQDEEFGS
ncbi:TonB-dependent receptor [Aquimarina sp. 2201CG1-2-11]|uniref:TonB-dependent receptor domain-containing protein n=1 Tax=Aquimarina discodermiae TaxID=3231043 RepID=UPI003462775C